MTTDPNCIFCKIVAGQIPSIKLLEDADTLAFMDISPAHDGRCLNRALSADGLNLVQANGPQSNRYRISMSTFLPRKA